MTTLGKSVVIAGLFIFTVGTLAWIITGAWEWFAGGLSLFVSSIIASAVLSVETKEARNSNTRYTANSPNSPNSNEPAPPPPEPKRWTEDDPFSTSP